MVFLLFSLHLLGAVTRQVRFLSDSENSLAQKTQRLNAALNNMSQGLAMFDRDAQLIVCNRRFVDIYLLTADQTKPERRSKTSSTPASRQGACRKALRDFSASAAERAAQNQSSSIVTTLPSGRIVSVTRQPMNHGGWLAIHQDISEQKRIETELEHMARYGLANRTLFLEKAGAARSECTAEPRNSRS